MKIRSGAQRGNKYLYASRESNLVFNNEANNYESQMAQRWECKGYNIVATISNQSGTFRWQSKYCLSDNTQQKLPYEREDGKVFLGRQFGFFEYEWTYMDIIFIKITL